MGNASSRWVEINAVLARERFDLRVFRQIFRRSILNVVVDGEHRLRRIGDRRRADLLELRDHRAGVVVRHHMTRTNRNEVAAAHLCARSKSVRMTPRNLLNKCKSHITLGLPATHTNQPKIGFYAARKCDSEQSKESLIAFRAISQKE